MNRQFLLKFAKGFLIFLNLLHQIHILPLLSPQSILEFLQLHSQSFNNIIILLPLLQQLLILIPQHLCLLFLLLKHSNPRFKRLNFFPHLLRLFLKRLSLHLIKSEPFLILHMNSNFRSQLLKFKLLFFQLLLQIMDRICTI